MEYMCSLTGKTEQEIYEELKGVIFLNPMYGYGNSTERKYLMADEYLSGNVREKLAWAKNPQKSTPKITNQCRGARKGTAERPDCQRDFRTARHDLAA